MKSEETKYEETLYEANQVNPSNEVNGNEEVNNSENCKSEKKSTWRKVGVGMGLGVLLGSTTSFMTTSTIVANPSKPDKPENPDNPTNPQQPEWTDGKVEIATTINDEMSFSQAFGAARAEVGSGGAFEWRGNVYSTYTAEEWNALSPEERNTYNEHFYWSQHQAAASQTATTTTATTQHGTEEQPTLPETVVVEETDVEISVQETTPEVEILGVVHDNETGANMGFMTVDDQEYILVDVDDDNVFDVMATDINGDGTIADNEIGDVSEYGLPVSDFESNSFGGSSMYASNDGLTDYTNDADDVYEA